MKTVAELEKENAELRARVDLHERTIAHLLKTAGTPQVCLQPHYPPVCLLPHYPPGPTINPYPWIQQPFPIWYTTTTNTIGQPSTIGQHSPNVCTSVFSIDNGPQNNVTSGFLSLGNWQGPTS